MFEVGGNQEVVASFEVHPLFINERQSRRTFEENDPLILRLIKPESLWARLSIRYNSLYPEGIRLEQGFNLFLIQRCR